MSAADVDRLGGNPFRTLLKSFLRLLLLGLLAVTVFLLLGDDGVIPAILAGALLVYMTLDMAGDLIAAHRNAAMWKESAEAVRVGLVTPEWILRDAACDGMVVVDETRRVVLVNGLVYAFEQIRTVVQAGADIEINVGSGADPLQRIGMDDADEAEAGSVRLINALGMPLVMEQVQVPAIVPD